MTPAVTCLFKPFALQVGVFSPFTTTDKFPSGLKACKSPEKGLLSQFLMFLAKKLAFPPSATAWLCQATA